MQLTVEYCQGIEMALQHYMNSPDQYKIQGISTHVIREVIKMQVLEFMSTCTSCQEILLRHLKAL